MFSFSVKDFNDASDVLRKLNVFETTPNNGVKLNDLLKSGAENVWFDLMLPYLRGYLFVCQSLSQVCASVSKTKISLRNINRRLEREIISQ